MVPEAAGGGDGLGQVAGFQVHGGQRPQVDGAVVEPRVGRAGHQRRDLLGQLDHVVRVPVQPGQPGQERFGPGQVVGAGYGLRLGQDPGQQGADLRDVVAAQRGHGQAEQAVGPQGGLADPFGQGQRVLQVVLGLGHVAVQQQEPGQEERGVADVLLLGIGGRGQAAARVVQVGLVHPEPVLRDPRHGQVKVVAVLPDRGAPADHRADRVQRGQSLLHLVLGGVLAGPAVHHQLQPLLDGGRVHLLWVPAEQVLGGVVGGPGRLVVVIGHLQPSQPGQQVRPAERVTGGNGAQAGLERLPGLPAPLGAPEHVGQLGLQLHRGLALARDGERGVVGRDGLVVREGRGGVVARDLVVAQGALWTPAAAKSRPRTAATSSVRPSAAASSAQAARPCSRRRSARSSPL